MPSSRSARANRETITIRCSKRSRGRWCAIDRTRLRKAEYLRWVTCASLRTKRDDVNVGNVRSRSPNLQWRFLNNYFWVARYESIYEYEMLHGLFFSWSTFLIVLFRNCWPISNQFSARTYSGVSLHCLLFTIFAVNNIDYLYMVDFLKNCQKINNDFIPPYLNVDFREKFFWSQFS